MKEIVGHLPTAKFLVSTSAVLHVETSSVKYWRSPTVGELEPSYLVSV